MNHFPFSTSRVRPVTVAPIKRLVVRLLLVAPLLLGAGAATAAEKPAPAARASEPEQDKQVLERLIAELQRSPRSFIYLRSKGFSQSDTEFGQLIARNNTVLQTTRIVRYDEKGVRQIPGWPGVLLTPEFKASISLPPAKGK